MRFLKMKLQAMTISILMVVGLLFNLEHNTVAYTPIVNEAYETLTINYVM